jgi:hypothetical protein
MTSLSDTLTVGLVLVLLFGSIALYLYTRIQQAEQKISLLESILLDLKMSAEIKSYSELPAENTSQKVSGGFSTEHNDNSYQPFESDDENPYVSDEEEEEEEFSELFNGDTKEKSSNESSPSQKVKKKLGNLSCKFWLISLTLKSYHITNQMLELRKHQQ